MKKRSRKRPWFLRQWRDHRKLSQEALAAKVGLTQGMISHLETGAVDYTGSHLEDLSAALDCTVYQLLFHNPRMGDDPLALFEALPEYERDQAIEMLKGLQRVAGRKV